MIAVGPLGERLASLAIELEKADGEVAICRDAMPTAGDVLGRNLNLAPFARMLAERAIPGTAPYFNTELFVCRSPAFLDAWADLALATPMHVNFDQNLFNFL